VASHHERVTGRDGANLQRVTGGRGRFAGIIEGREGGLDFALFWHLNNVLEPFFKERKGIRR